MKPAMAVYISTYWPGLTPPSWKRFLKRVQNHPRKNNFCHQTENEMTVLTVALSSAEREKRSQRL
jgi:hypothetical protein